MSEKPGAKEFPFGKEWAFFGKDLGLKTQDLIDCQKENPGLNILAGIGVGASFHRDFLNNNSQITDDLHNLNRELLGMIPTGQPIIIRSSALDERGGTGIYESEFLVLTGNAEEDLKRLWDAEEKVYVSYSSEDGKLYRKYISQSQGIGMGLLIQPVVGDRMNDGCFGPLISGVMAEKDGKFQLRLVVGLGTKAVATREAIMLEGDDIDVESIDSELDTFNEAYPADMIDNGRIGKIGTTITKRWKEMIRGQAQKILDLKKAWEEQAGKGSYYYWEFAIDQSVKPAYIVQSAPETSHVQLETECDQPEGKVLIEGDDVVNLGKRKGRGIIVVGEDGYDCRDLDLLKFANMQIGDYLLIISDQVLSTRADISLHLRHFSNAAAVIELQSILEDVASATVVHTAQVGGSHFAKLCKKRHILFLGCPINQKDIVALLKRLGKCDRKLGRSGGFWDVDFKVTNCRGKGMVELLPTSKSEKPRLFYIPSGIQYGKEDMEYYWPARLNRCAEQLEEKGGDNQKSISYTIVCGFLRGGYFGEPIYELNLKYGFDPFRLVEVIELKDIPEMLLHIQAVLGSLTEVDEDKKYPEDGLVMFLNELYQRLLIKMKASPDD